MKINDHILKLSGEVSIAEGLENDTDYLAAIEGGVISVTEKPNGDGTADKIYKFKPSKVQVLDGKGKTIKSTDKKRNSQKFRNMINFFRQEKYPEIEEEQFYDSFMGKAMARFDDITRLLEQK